MFKYKIYKIKDVEELKDKLAAVTKKNEKLMMTHYSSKAACEIMDEIREIIDCPKGYNITKAITKLKIAEISIKDLELSRGAIGYLLSRPDVKWWHESYRQLAKRIDYQLKKYRGR